MDRDMVMDMDMVTVTDKVLRALLLTVLTLLAAVIPAASQSMIPDDFDWSVYGTWDNSDFYNWGTGSQTDYSDTDDYYSDDYYSDDYYTDTSYAQDPIIYNWYGTTYEVYPYSQSFSPQSGGSVQTPDQWFYQDLDGLYDEFSGWTGSGNIPESAYVSGFTGYAQSYNLDCEARSAIDLAAYFGVNIGHSDFLNRLPKSDDPNEGFVGNYSDPRGKIPPASYGVYEKPIAQLLQQYGLNAVGVYGYSENGLKSQIASGRPVMVWVVGNTELGYPVSYTASSTGNTTAVVPYQHTVVVIGYDSKGVIIQDGGMKYSRDWNTFLLSWGVLGNRAVYVN